MSHPAGRGQAGAMRLSLHGGPGPVGVGEGCSGPREQPVRWPRGRHVWEVREPGTAGWHRDGLCAGGQAASCLCSGAGTLATGQPGSHRAREQLADVHGDNGVLDQGGGRGDGPRSTWSPRQAWRWMDSAQWEREGEPFLHVHGQ